ncbi:MAG: hypothetical protein J0L78_01855 [Planctomycetes bacterium]|nr:hypothetical protein [Planctomycetota bacterium]
MMQPVVIPSFAKINLALAVSPPEPGLIEGVPNPRAGWHRICSLFSCVDLADTLELAPLPTGPSRFTIRWAHDAPNPSPIDWPVEKDLIFRAHALVESTVGRALPVDAVLTKRIPVGGGMGGGSSNGAAMIRGLADLHRLELGSLLPIGAKLGSDVPFFFDEARRSDDPARPALVEGFGERITRRGPIESSILLICPSVSCPTPAVYRAFDRWLLEHPSFRFREADVRAAFSDRGSLDPSALLNDLAEPAFFVAPALRALHAAASGVCGPVHVTGSGSTLFAVVRAHEAASIAATLRGVCAGATVIVTALR